MASMDGGSARPGPGTTAAYSALVVGLLFAAISAYWAVGGTWLLDTVGGAIEREGRSGNGVLVAGLVVVVLLKVVAAVLGVAALRPSHGLFGRLVRLAAWVGAVIMTVYGAVLTTVGLLVQTDVIHASAAADHRALRWHAYLWDPWFAVWGVLLAVALLQSRRRLHRDLPASG
jgi:Protein of unknown function (DUF3995)